MIDLNLFYVVFIGSYIFIIKFLQNLGVDKRWGNGYSYSIATGVWVFAFVANQSYAWGVWALTIGVLLGIISGILVKTLFSLQHKS
jgi:hypothetical protein